MRKLQVCTNKSKQFSCSPIRLNNENPQLQLRGPSSPIIFYGILNTSTWALFKLFPLETQNLRECFPWGTKALFPSKGGEFDAILALRTLSKSISRYSHIEKYFKTMNRTSAGFYKASIREFKTFEDHRYVVFSFSGLTAFEIIC